MSYGGFRRSAGRGMARVNQSGVAPSTRPAGNNYINQESSIRRHEFINQANISILAGLNHPIALAAFTRSFAAGVDVPPTPDASNNYRTHRVFNGSRIENFNCKLFLKNTSTAVGTSYFLDIFMVAVSFYDVLVWDTILPANCPLVFGLGVNFEGEIGQKAQTVDTVNEDAYRDYKFIQHYLKHLGSVEVAANADDSAQVVVDIPDIPAKCRRSQTGMYYGLFLYNSPSKNNNAQIDYNVSIDESFMEIPSDNRLPFIE